MSNQCKLEFYFKTADLEKLLHAHPGAKGIIISQEIVKEKPKGAEQYVNVVHIRARADNGAKAGTDQKIMGAVPDDGCIDGCPFPPGCTN